MWYKCDDCNGIGGIKIDGTGFLGYFCKYEKCYACRGDGKGKPSGWPYPKLMERMTPNPPPAPPTPCIKREGCDEPKGILHPIPPGTYILREGSFKPIQE